MSKLITDEGIFQHDRNPAVLGKDPQRPPPVFILAPARRSGTNYLASMLRLHREFQLPNLLWEDHVLVHSQLLAEYAFRTSKSRGWDERILNREDYAESLLRHLGAGILAFLLEQIGENRRLLCKTPRGCNIDKFFRLFPNARLVILIRDGRDVVTSAVKEGRHRFVGFEWYSYSWAKGARSILEFMRGRDSILRENSWKLVKFEDLVERPESVLRDLLPFLSIDVTTFAFNQVPDLPLIGSSFVRGGRERVNWDPISKPDDFQPVGRWKSWGYWRKIIFKLIASRELAQLGYVENSHW